MKLDIQAKPYEKLTPEEKKKLRETYDNCCSVKDSAKNWIEKFERNYKK